MNLLRFFLNTYETDVLHSSTSKHGRKPSEQIPYMDGTGNGQRYCVICHDGHEMIQNFIGDWFPQNDLEVSTIYHTSMLALLLPWRDIRDVKMQMETPKEEFDTFVIGSDARMSNILANIKYQHECSNSAAKKCLRERKQIILWDCQIMGTLR
jgi:hypothetical protein